MKHSNIQKQLNLAIKGDANAFAALLESHYMMIYRIAFKWAGNKEDAEDIAQEVCVKVGRSINNFRLESQFSTWLYRIVVNTAADFQRKKRQHIHLNETSEANLSEHHYPQSAAEDSELWQYVKMLPNKLRQAILLVYAEDLTHLQVANIMQCKESTVSWYIHKAKKKLKTLMKHDGR